MTGYERTLMLLDDSLRQAHNCVKEFKEGRWDGEIEPRFLGHLKLIEFYTKALERFYTDLCIDPSEES